MQWLAVGHSSRGAKLSSARYERQLLALFPVAHADHARATRTHIFRKCRFPAGRPPMAVEHHGYFHRDALLGAKKRMCSLWRHGGPPSTPPTPPKHPETFNATISTHK